MNEILKNRIEEAAFQESSMYDTIQEKNAAYNTGMKIANFALQNQWISVEEALPKDFEKVFFRAVGKNDSICYGTGYVVKEDWYTDIQCVEQDYFKFKITHWMPIPSLEGGEK